MKQGKYNNSKKKKSASPLVWILGVVLILVAVLLGIMAVSVIRGGHPVQTPTPAASGENPSEPVETTAPSPITELAIEATDTDMVVQTPYGKLYYPAELMQYMRVEQEIDGRNVIIRYYAKIDDVEYTEVFSVWFGQKQEIVCGTVPNEQGAVTMVTIDMNLDIPQDDWQEDMRLRTFMLQEGVNHLMEKMDQLDSFVRAE